MHTPGSRLRPLKVAAALALLALALMAAACGGDDEGSGDAATSAAPAASEAATSEAAPATSEAAASSDAAPATSEAAPATSEAAPAASGEGKKLGLVVLNERDPDLAKMTEAMKGAAEAAGAELIVVDSKGDVATELTQMEDLVTSKPDAIVMMPIDGEASQAAAKRANEAGIPLFLLSTEFAEGADVKIESYIGVDDTEAGRMQADYVNTALPSGGKIIYLVGTYGASWTDRRKAGFMEKKAANIEIATELQTNGSRDEGKKVMEDLLAKYGPGEISGVVVHNDEAAIGAASAIKDAGRQADFGFVIGVDGTEPGLEAIADGSTTATVLQRSAEQGVKAIDVMLASLAGTAPDPRYDLPFTLVTKDNVADFLQK